jgi:3-phosphoshikimate 1-carboxyvinyltransferase
MLKKVSKLNKGLKGEIIIPADKSVSHRAVMFSSIARGKCIIKNFSSGADCHSTLNIFRQLGVDIEFIDKKTLLINSDGILKPSSSPLDAGNSGTTTRLISGILAGQNFDSVIIGDESLSKRPMKRIIEPLTLMGAEIDSVDGHAPLTIKGRKLHGINYHSKLASAQVKSCVLLAGLKAEGETTYAEPYLSRNHTELLLDYLGANIKNDKNSVTVKPSILEAKDINIVGDISSAAFFIVAGLIVPNSDFIIKNVGLNPTRTGIIDVVNRMGGGVNILNQHSDSGEEVGDIRVQYHNNLKGCTIQGEDIPRLIDELPVIAVLASQAEGQTIVKNAEDLRNKESDRIKCLVFELTKIGENIKKTPDGFIINGKTKIKGEAELESYHDHRLAMSFYTAGLIADQEIGINGFEWTKISFPEFKELVQRLNG